MPAAIAAPHRAEDQTVGAFLGQWLAHVRGGVRPRTFTGYESLVRVNAVPAIGDLMLRALRPLDLQDLYAAMLARGVSAGTALNMHLVLSNALGQAERWGLVERSPATGAQPPRPERPEHLPVDPALAGLVLAAAADDPRFEVPVALALATGMRRGEILALRWSDVDRDLSVAHVRRTLHVSAEGPRFAAPKTRRSRRAVQLPAFVRPYLERERAQQRSLAEAPAWEDHDLVCPRPDGRPRHPDTLSSGWYSFCKRKGLPRVRFHDLRHAHATLMLLQGVHPKVVSERLGHASVGITLDTYSHVLPSMQAEAVRAFDELFPQPS